MKAISLWQPWASLVALGEKKFETRSWYTPYRGPLAIHAARRWTREIREIAARPIFRERLARHGINQGVGLPLGRVVATCRLVGCHEMGGRSLADPDLMRLYGLLDGGYELVTVAEEAFGDWTPGRFAWRLTDVRALPSPLPFRGAQGFFEVPDSVRDGLDSSVPVATQGDRA